jgi:hypothetical protein
MKGSSRALGLVIAGATLLAFGTPLRALWADAARPWWTVYALWAVAIVALALCAARGRDGTR